MFLLDDILHIAVQLEINGEKTYRQAADKTAQDSLVSFFLWMADQEKTHAQWFEQMKSGGDIGEDQELIQMGRGLLEDIVGEHSFSLDDLDLSRVENFQELVRVSIEFEKDTVLFYEMLAAFVEDKESRALVTKIISEEHRHVRMLEEFLGN